mmetsp:Transcript_19331/g.22810  ORF Transcript_19331/g.22810 Transcript_19331/m.22810 type:complete len:90 (-) Transcript_19331:271-540(-)
MAFSQFFNSRDPSKMVEQGCQHQRQAHSHLEKTQHSVVDIGPVELPSFPLEESCGVKYPILHVLNRLVEFCTENPGNCIKYAAAKARHD